RLLVEGELDLGGLAEKDAKERSDRVSKRLEHAARHVLATLPDRLAKEVERVRVELRAFDPLGELRLPRLEIRDSLVKADRVLSLQPRAERESIILELALPFLRGREASRVAIDVGCDVIELQRLELLASRLELRQESVELGSLLPESFVELLARAV